MAGNPEQQGVHTIAVSKTTASILVGVVVVAVGGFARSYWDLASVSSVLVEQVAQLRQFASAGDRCTRETCQNTREALERLRDDVRKHRDEAEEWKRRIVVCESNVGDCAACRFELGLRKNGNGKR